MKKMLVVMSLVVAAAGCSNEAGGEVGSDLIIRPRPDYLELISVAGTTPDILFDNVQIGVRFQLSNIGTKPSTGRVSGNIDGIPLHGSAPDYGQINNLLGVMSGTLYTTGQEMPSGAHTIHLTYERATGTIVIPYPYPHYVTTYTVAATVDQAINIVATPDECDSLPHGSVMIEQKRLHWDNVVVASGGGDPGTPSVHPYLWTVYFKADGSTLALDSGGKLQGHALITANNGNHGDLNVSSLQVGSGVDIPANIGVWSASLQPIPVDPAIQGILGVKELPGFFGAVTVIMTDGGHISDEGVAAGHQALNSYVQTALDNIIASIGPGHQMVTQADIDSVTNGAEDTIKNAIVSAQSVWENLWSLTGPDASAGHATSVISRADFSGATRSESINKIINDKLGGWGVDGTAVVCP